MKGFNPISACYITFTKSRTFNTSFLIENYHGNDTKQCYRCQFYGHSSVTCLLTTQVSKLWISHTPELYPNKDKTSKCVNYSGSHSTYYSVRTSPRKINQSCTTTRTV